MSSYETKPYRLSVCISTYNRASFICATLESLLAQARADCEILVSDNASTDETERIVTDYARRYQSIKYFRHDTNNGPDENYDRAVALTSGEYCWLMSDDDVLKPSAIETVYRHLEKGFSLIVVNTEFRTFDLSRVTVHKFVDSPSDIIYDGSDIDGLLIDAGVMLCFNGCVVIKRELWLSRERKKYYGCWYLHFAVIFQQSLPGKILLVAEPQVSYRDGNIHTYSSRMFEIGTVVWPSLVWSMAPSDSAKKRICRREVWKEVSSLLWYRAWGFYSLLELRVVVRPRLKKAADGVIPALVALIPGVLINVMLMLYYAFFGKHRDLQLYRLATSRFHPGNLRIVHTAMSILRP